MKGESEDSLRVLTIYAVAGLMMLFLVPAAWIGVSGAFVMALVEDRPEVRAEMNRVWDLYRTDPFDLGSLDPDSPRMVALRQVHEPIMAEVDWFLVALAVSLLVLPLLGYFCGRYSGEPAWAGALPILGLLTSNNPATLLSAREETAALAPSLPEQLGVVVLQVVVVHMAADWGAGVYRRRFGG